MTTTTWTSCATPPTRDGTYELQCLFPDGLPLCEIEIVRWENGQWITGFGLSVMPHDRYRSIEQEQA